MWFLLVVAATVYAFGVGRLWRRAGSGGGIEYWRTICFGAGLLALAAGGSGVAVRLAASAFSAHMVQHELFMLVAAPLLVLGRPDLALLWGLPRYWRTAAETKARWSGIARTMRWLLHPGVAFLIHAAAIWLLHIPSWFEAGLASEGLHAIQHLLLMATALLFWWSVIAGRYGRVGYGASVVYVFGTAIHTGVLGALIATAGSVWYGSYLTTTVPWGIDALHDQQLAGLLMWIPAGGILIVAGVAFAGAWLAESERRLRRPSPQTRSRKGHCRT